MTTTHFGINAETMMCGQPVDDQNHWTNEVDLVHCRDCYDLVNKAANYAMRNKRTPKQVREVSSKSV